MSGVNPLDRHGSLYALAQAGADGDAVTEERGLEGAVTDLGISLEDLRYVAEQRALRAVLASAGRQDELKRLTSDRSFASVKLTPEEQKQMALFTATYLDGIALGVRYQQRRAAPFGLGDALRP
jgi:hypothetical protein